MFAKAWTKRGEADPISTVLGDSRYATPYYPKGLSDPRMKFPIGVTRCYLLMSPPVIVDFEPSPLDDVPQMHCEAKRKWAHEHGMVYIPVFLREKLTSEQFEERVNIERAALKESGTRKEYGPAPEVADPEFFRLVDEETVRRFAALIRYRPVLRGAAKQSMLRRVREEVETEYLRKRTDGELGRYVSYHKPALAAR